MIKIRVGWEPLTTTMRRHRCGGEVRSRRLKLPSEGTERMFLMRLKTKTRCSVRPQSPVHVDARIRNRFRVFSGCELTMVISINSPSMDGPFYQHLADSRFDSDGGDEKNISMRPSRTTFSGSPRTLLFSELGTSRVFQGATGFLGTPGERPVETSSYLSSEDQCKAITSRSLLGIGDASCMRLQPHSKSFVSHISFNIFITRTTELRSASPLRLPQK
ncbi:hypothetical protein EVAR_6412_1 [Eumeta japonica]|uniref:Uncharacterized protein n=1 Tax=Eumeta variegata TaxID=151549 RepID=A0A4C1TG08_EUMVA|nr:hypothetical protein EVAR_6412_1 [Eumeta japonica]